jgi:hypothetical protein
LPPVQPAARRAGSRKTKNIFFAGASWVFGWRRFRGKLRDLIAQAGVKHRNHVIPRGAFVRPDIDDQIRILLVARLQPRLNLQDVHPPTLIQIFPPGRNFNQADVAAVDVARVSRRCDGDTFLDAWSWESIREANPSYPVIPEEGNVYLMYPERGKSAKGKK